MFRSLFGFWWTFLSVYPVVYLALDVSLPVWLNWASVTAWCPKPRASPRDRPGSGLLMSPPVEPSPLPHPVPPYTPGVSLHGSWCKAPLINLPKLVCVCVRMWVCVYVFSSTLKHILQAGRQVTTKTSQSGSWLKCQWCMAEKAKRKSCREEEENENETQGEEKKIHKTGVEEAIWFSERARLHF